MAAADESNKENGSVEYTKGKVVGRGTWGVVCAGIAAATGRKVAIKEIHSSMERYEVWSVGR